MAGKKTGRGEITTRLDGTKTRREGSGREREGAGIERDEELYVTCRRCGWPIASGIRIRRDALEASRPEARAHRCPRCGAAESYGPAEYAHRD